MMGLWIFSFLEALSKTTKRERSFISLENYWTKEESAYAIDSRDVQRISGFGGFWWSSCLVYKGWEDANLEI
jgi:hypothetical protein